MIKKTTLFWLKVISPFVLFIAGIIENGYQIDSILLSVMVIALLLYCVLEYLNFNNKIVDNQNKQKYIEGIELMRRGQAIFDQAHRANNYNKLGTSLALLNQAKNILIELENQEYNIVDILNTVGLIHEKFAYKGCSYANIYTVVDGRLNEEEHPSNMDRIIAEIDFHPTEICCTEIVETDNWKKAREAYDKIFDIINKAKVLQQGSSSSLYNLAASRSAGYFFLCDFLKFKNKKSLDKAEVCLTIYNETSVREKIPPRIEDSIQKLNFLKAIRKV